MFPKIERNNTPKQDEVPAGYMKNALGHLVPTELVRESDMLRDELVRELTEAAVKLSDELQAFKRKALEDIEALIALSAEKYGIKIGGKGGNAQLLLIRRQIPRGAGKRQGHHLQRRNPRCQGIGR